MLSFSLFKCTVLFFIVFFVLFFGSSFLVLYIFCVYLLMELEFFDRKTFEMFKSNFNKVNFFHK